MGIPGRSTRSTILILCFAHICLPILLFLFVWNSMPHVSAPSESPVAYALALPAIVAFLLHQRNYLAKLGTSSWAVLQSQVTISLAVAEIGVLLAIFLVRSQLGVYVALAASLVAMMKITMDVAMTWQG